MSDKYDAIKLDNQICFPLYACAKEIVRRYKPFLDELDLTYTQYIAMMVLWEGKEINVKDLGKKYALSRETFRKFPENDQEFLQNFSFICLLSYDVYIKKMIIESVIDNINSQNSKTNKKENSKKESSKKDTI